MKVVIRRVWNTKLDEYKVLLNKYDAIYSKEDNEYFATIEIKDLHDLFTLARELEEDLIINSTLKENTIEIYDDYIE